MRLICGPSPFETLERLRRFLDDVRQWPDDDPNKRGVIADTERWIVEQQESDWRRALKGGPVIH